MTVWSQGKDSIECVHVYKFRISGVATGLHVGLGPSQGCLCGHAVQYGFSSGTVPLLSVTIREHRNARSRASLAVDWMWNTSRFELLADTCLLFIE